MNQCSAGDAATLFAPGWAGHVYELTVSVFCPTAHDLELLLSLVRGYLARDQIRRPLATTPTALPGRSSHQRQGMARPIYLSEAPSGLELRDLEGHRAGLPTLDHATFGANRARILEALPKKASA